MNKCKQIIAVLLAILCICTLFSSCGKTENYHLKDEIQTENSSDAYHTDSEKYETITKNNYIEMCIDKTNHSLCVKDLTTGQKWTALCNGSNNYSYAFAVKLYTPMGYCEMNTQDNSVAFSASQYSANDGVLTVCYTLSNKKETAVKSAEDMADDDIFVSFDVTYKLKEQTVYVSIDLNNMKCTKNGFVSEISVMPYFGSQADSVADWFLIPDNSGAIMHLSSSDAGTDNVSADIYGKNLYNIKSASESTEENATATLPVYGIKRNNSAFCAVITDGDALARINAKRKNDSQNSNIGTVFTITEVTDETNGKIRKGPSYDGNISVAYKFLSEQNATYSAMATVCREELIKNGKLSSSTTDSVTEIPFCLAVVGGENKSPLTTTEQTTDILGILKGKGISNIILSYKGLYSGGIAKGNIYSSSISRKLGGKDGLEKLYDYAKKQGCTLLQGVNILSAGKSVLPADRLYTISADKAVYGMKNSLAYNENASSGLITRIGKEAADLGAEKTDASIYSQTGTFNLNLYNTDAFKNKFNSFLDGNALDFSDGICVTDAGNILCSDGKMTRQEVMKEVESMLRAVSNYGTLAVDGGNLYSLYNASIVTNMSFDTFYNENVAYEAVPFAQSVLHGSILYAAQPIDAGNPLYRYEMLRYIEYGAVPSYEWIYENENIYCYNGYLLSERISEIVDFYNDATEMLSDLTDDRIVNHRKITTDSDGKIVSGLYCTEYSDGTEIYVNYTGSVITTPENIAVGPYDYVKVKR